MTLRIIGIVSGIIGNLKGIKEFIIGWRLFSGLSTTGRRGAMAQPIGARVGMRMRASCFFSGSHWPFACPYPWDPDPSRCNLLIDDRNTEQ